MRLIAIDTNTGKVVENGDIVVDFRGDNREFVKPALARGEGHSGKIHLLGSHPVYDKVANLAVLDLDDNKQYLGGLPDQVAATFKALAGRMTAAELPDPSPFDGTCVRCGGGDLTLSWEYRYAPSKATVWIPGATGPNPFSLGSAQTTTVTARETVPMLLCNSCGHCSPSFGDRGLGSIDNLAEGYAR
ncbi:hypothetical protein [Gordonia malaquae]|uniref:hypothetical protein n=1 Tax=Gordonia malaquae TaxID=410332 RepID=UPI003019E2C5